MEDREIVAMFLGRLEAAIAECGKKYGAYCRRVAMNILGREEDAREVENDTYLKAWNTIPPNEPDPLRPYLAALSRRTAIDRLRAMGRERRGGGQYEPALSELSSFGGGDPADVIALRDSIDGFLAALNERDRGVFMRRYFWFCSVREIAEELEMGESAVKMSLSRAREKLRDKLEKEGML